MKRTTRRAVIKSIIGGGVGFTIGEYWINTSDTLVSLAVAILVGVAAYLLFVRRERNREPDRIATDVSETITEAGVACSGAHPTGYAMAHHQYALHLFKNGQVEQAQQIAEIAADAGPMEEAVLSALAIDEDSLDALSTTDHSEGKHTRETSESKALECIQLGAYDQARQLVNSSTPRSESISTK